MALTSAWKTVAWMTRLQTTSCPLPCPHAVAPTPFSVLKPSVYQTKPNLVLLAHVSILPTRSALRLLSCTGFRRTTFLSSRQAPQGPVSPAVRQAPSPFARHVSCGSVCGKSLKAIFLIHRSRGGKPRRVSQAARGVDLMHPTKHPSTILWILSRASLARPPSTYNMATVQWPLIPVVGVEQSCTAIWPYPTLNPKLIQRLFCRPSRPAWPSHKRAPGIWSSSIWSQVQHLVALPPLKPLFPFRTALVLIQNWSCTW